MALFYDEFHKQISCNQCYTYFSAPDGPHEFTYHGQIFNTGVSDCPHCERHGVPEFIVNDTAPEPPPKLKDWGAF